MVDRGCAKFSHVRPDWFVLSLMFTAVWEMLLWIALYRVVIRFLF